MPSNLNILAKKTNFESMNEPTLSKVNSALSMMLIVETE